MAQLYFRYSTMNAGKSIEVLRVCHNYEEQGKRVLLFTSSHDDRYGKGVVASRIGVQKEAIIIGDETDIYNEVEKHNRNPDRLFCVLVDEAEFLKEHHIFQLSRIVDDLDIPVICYGLKNNFKNELFEGSEALLRLADKIEEIKTVCTVDDCRRKATMVLRFQDGKPIYDGPEILIGGNDLYKSVCRKHYYNWPE